MKFSELQLNANVLEALDAMRFDECTQNLTILHDSDPAVILNNPVSGSSHIRIVAAYNDNIMGIM